MKNILVIDDMAIFREPIAASLRLAGYQTCCAGDGIEAMALLTGATPDLILLDMAMPRMDGLMVLRRLKADARLAKIPVILLTAVSDKKHVVQAARLGVRDYMLKGKFSLPDLLSRVERHLSPEKLPEVATSNTQGHASELPPAQTPGVAMNPNAQIPQLMQRDDCIARAQQALASKTLSGVVAQVISLAASPRADASQISTLISRDPMLSARILHAANSAAYASQKGIVTTIAEAIRNIGFTNVRNIAAAMGIFDAMPESGPDGFNPIRCWQHSFAVAQICERLQAEVNPEEAGIAYLVGLCHDLGEILFHTHFSAEYKRVLAIQQQTGKNRLDLEQAMLGISHRELMRTILQHIGLPETIRTPIEAAHRAGYKTDPKEPLARILGLAELYANGAQLASSGESFVAPVTKAECTLAVGKADPDRPDGPMLRGEVMSLTALLARLSAKEQEKLIEPLFPPTGLRFRLVRDPAYSSFGPVAAALESVGELTLGAALPGDAERSQIDAVVVMTQSTQSPRVSEAEIEAFQRQNAQTPLLWLVDEIVNPQSANCRLKLLPINLQTLMDFVASVPTQTAKAA